MVNRYGYFGFNHIVIHISYFKKAFAAIQQPQPVLGAGNAKAIGAGAIGFKPAGVLYGKLVMVFIKVGDYFNAPAVHVLAYTVLNGILHHYL